MSEGLIRIVCVPGFGFSSRVSPVVSFYNNSSGWSFRETGNTIDADFSGLDDVAYCGGIELRERSDADVAADEFMRWYNPDVFGSDVIIGFSYRLLNGVVSMKVRCLER